MVKNGNVIYWEKKIQKWIKWENMSSLWIFDSFEGQNTIPFTF
jgi:hypothetical protein